MTPADRAQAAQKILDDPLAKELLSGIETTAIEAMLRAPDDSTRRECRDTVLTIRKLRASLQSAITANREAERPRPTVV